MDTMTFTKVLGGLCGSLLVFLLGSWVAEEMYHTGGKHGDEQQAYAIEVESDEAEVEVVEVSFDEAFAAASPTGFANKSSAIGSDLLISKRSG